MFAQIRILVDKVVQLVPLLSSSTRVGTTCGNNFQIVLSGRNVHQVVTCLTVAINVAIVNVRYCTVVSALHG